MNKNQKINRIKIIAVIQARMGSKRLPKKVLMDIHGRSTIEWMVYRLSFSKEIDGVVIATAETADNDLIAAEAERIGIPCYRGSESDLISRYLGVAKRFDAYAVVRLGGDCPLVDPRIVDDVVSVFRKNAAKADFVANNVPPTYPYGMDVEVIPTKTLEILDQKVSDSLYREWLTMNIIEHRGDFNVINVKSKKNMRSVRLALDYPEDMTLIERIFMKLHSEGRCFSLDDIAGLLAREPILSKINERWAIDATIDNVRKNEEFQRLKKNSHV